MIDISARSKACSILQSLFDGGITNYHFEDSWPASAQDEALNAIQEQLWLLYDDFPEQRLTRQSFTDAEVKMLERCLVFLRSNREYAWPRYSPRTGNRRWFERLLGLGKKRSQEQLERFQSAGDLSVWPFVALKDFDAELRMQGPAGH